MRHTHSTISYRSVCQLALRCFLDALQWTARSVTAPPTYLIQLMLRAAVQKRSLSAVVGLTQDGPCWQTVRNTLALHLPTDPLTLQPVITAALLYRLPKALTQHARTIAIDYHLRPYYGHKNTKGVYRGQAKAGTKTFFAYATVIVLRKGQRFTVALTHVAKGDEQTDVLTRLLAQVHAAGLRVRRVLLDRGFYAATTMQWLQDRQLAFVMPMIRRGKPGRTKHEGTGTQRFFVSRRRGWDRYTFTTRPRRQGRKQPAVTVTIDVCMVPRSQHRSRGKGPLVFACHGISGSPRDVAKWYRRRFGIETSYRQLGQLLAPSSSTKVVYRLLVVLISLVLRNLWVWLHWQYISERTSSGRQFHWERLRLQTLALGLASVLDNWLHIRLDGITITTQTTNNEGVD